MQGNVVSRAHRTLAALFAIFAAMEASCSRGSLPDGSGSGGAGGGAARDASLDDTAGGGSGGSGAGAGGGIGGGGAGGVGGVGGVGIGGSGAGPIDAGGSDGTCEISCFPPGGQYCGRIGGPCPRIFIDCPPCMEEGFVCGGSGVKNLCGAALDSGACKPTQCKQPGGQYCGIIGGGCGHALDCAGCPPGMTCGGGGIPNVCGRTPIDCMPLQCQHPGGNYCGTLGNGCGASIDCGTCPTGQTCGARTENICATPCPLCSQIARCEDAGATTVSGTALTAALSNAPPVPGALVYIPNIAAGAKLPPLSDGPRCNACLPLHPDNVVAAAVTGSDGRFTLRDVPSGTGIPIVVQLGQWRMQSTIDVVPCVDNALPSGTVHLPSNQTQGDIPLTAIATGNHDSIECLLRKIGIDDTEFTHPSGTGRIHLYRSNGASIDANTPDESALKGSADAGSAWGRYSQVLLPCEGAEMPETGEALGHFTDYVNSGGRVLTTHFGYVWLFHNGAFGDIGTWTPGSAAPAAPLPADVMVSSTRRIDFATWLGLAGALSRPTPPQMQIAAPHADLGPLITGKGGWLWLSSSSPATSQAVSIPAPILSPPAHPDKACGRVTFADFHASTTPSQNSIFPSECAVQATLSAEEKALLFLLFDLFSCAASDVIPATPRAPPRPPDPPPRPPPPPPPPPPPIGP